MRRRRPGLAVLCLLALLTASCATTASPAAVAGVTLDELGATFVATGTLMNELRQTNAINETDYQPWRAFAATFKPTYQAAVLAYQAGATDGDAVRAALALKAELLRYLITAAKRKGAQP